MIRVMLDIHVGMGCKKTLNSSIGDVEPVMLSRLQEIDTTNPKFSFTPIIDSRGYFLENLQSALPHLKTFVRFPHRFYLLYGISISIGKHIKTTREDLNRRKISFLNVDIIETHEDLSPIDYKFNYARRKYKKVVFIHNYIISKWKNLSELETYLTGLKKADLILAVSESIRQELITRIIFLNQKLRQYTMQLVRKYLESLNYQL